MRFCSVLVCSLALLYVVSGLTYEQFLAQLAELNDDLATYANTSINTCGVGYVTSVALKTGVATSPDCGDAQQVLFGIAQGTASLATLNPAAVCGKCVSRLQAMATNLSDPTTVQCNGIGGIIANALSYDTKNQMYCSAITSPNNTWFNNTFMPVVGKGWFDSLSQPASGIQPLNVSLGECTGASFCAYQAFSTYTDLFYANIGGGDVNGTKEKLFNALAPCGVAPTDISFCGPLPATPTPTPASTTKAPDIAKSAVAMAIDLIPVAFVGLITKFLRM